jgi:hypothetical protein
MAAKRPGKKTPSLNQEVPFSQISQETPKFQQSQEEVKKAEQT